MNSSEEGNYDPKHLASGIPLTGVTQVSQDVVQSFVHFCERQGVNANEPDSAMKLCVLVSLKGVDRKNLCDSICPSLFVDWVQLSKGNAATPYNFGKMTLHPKTPHSGDSLPNDTSDPSINVFGDNLSVWIQLMQYFSLNPEVCNEHVAKAAQDPVPQVLLTYFSLLTQSGIDLSFEDMTRLFVLCSVNNQTMLNTVTQYYQTIGRTPVSTQAQNFVGKYVDNRVKFESVPCLDGMKWIFKNSRISDEFSKEVQLHHKHRGAVKKRTQLLTVLQVNSGRPRLRNRLLVSQELDQRRGTTLNPNAPEESQDSFAGWCTRVRFPNNVCMWLRQRLYFLRCQPFQINDVVHKMVSHDVASAVIDNIISTPDTTVIDSVIARMVYHRTPFKEMVDFRKIYFAGLAHAHQTSIKNPQLMQLYCAAYQDTKMWKNHWQEVNPVINHTIITAVEKFVHTTPFNAKAVIDTLEES